MHLKIRLSSAIVLPLILLRLTPRGHPYRTFPQNRDFSTPSRVPAVTSLLLNKCLYFGHFGLIPPPLTPQPRMSFMDAHSQKKLKWVQIIIGRLSTLPSISILALGSITCRQSWLQQPKMAIQDHPKITFGSEVMVEACHDWFWMLLLGARISCIIQTVTK